MENSQINYQQQKKKQTILMIIGVVVLVIGLVGVTYAFFNYTRTGSPNIIRVGKMNFSSNQTETIGLVNVFPISSTDALTDTTNTDEAIITITGDTTYERGIEYKITAIDVNNTVNNKTVPISIIVGASNGLGTSDDDYFDNRGGDSSIYKILAGETVVNDGQLIVGYIANGATGINGTVTIRAYIDSSKISISDTFDGTASDNNGTTAEWVNNRTVFTTEEWNSLQTNGISFKVKVEANEGTWVKSVISLYNAMLINNNSGESGGSGTGQSGSSPSLSNIPLDSDNSTYVQNVSSNTMTKAKVQFLGANSSEHRVMRLSAGVDFSQASSETNGKGLYMRAGTQDDPHPIIYYRGDVTNNNVAFAGFCWQIVRTTETGGIKLLYNGVQDEHGTCTPLTNTCDDEASCEASTEESEEEPEENNNLKRIREQTMLEINGESRFQFDNSRSFGSNGYMYGKTYDEIFKPKITNGIYYGSGFTYGNGVYTLTGATVTKPDTTHHYSCNSTNANATCSEIEFIYEYDGVLGSFIILTDGDGIEDALEKAQINTNNSNAKQIIDDWYASNLTGYTNYLEDTIWCNDRSLSDISILSPTGDFNNNYDWGRIYSNANRLYNLHTPSLTCPQANDRFTVHTSNGNGALTYPIGLLTADEMLLSGLSIGRTGTDSYLFNFKGNWAMTPAIGQGISMFMFLGSDGTLFTDGVDNTFGLRPAISLKPGTTIASNGADGTLANPYIVE